MTINKVQQGFVIFQPLTRNIFLESSLHNHYYIHHIKTKIIIVYKNNNIIYRMNEISGIYRFATPSDHVGDCRDVRAFFVRIMIYTRTRRLSCLITVRRDHVTPRQPIKFPARPAKPYRK